MEGIRANFTWVIRNFFFIFAVIFATAYLIWFWMAFDLNLIFGIMLLVFYALCAILFQAGGSRLWIKLILLMLTAYLCIANILYLTKAFPHYNNMTFRNETIYIITNQSDYSEPQYWWVQLRRWKWGLIPDMESLGHAWGDLTFVYNRQTKVVGIVRDTGYGGRLIYTDDGDHARHYEFGIEYEDHLYYPSKDCLNWTYKSYGYSCESYEWRIYQCELDNLSCIALPMKYLGYEWDAELESNDSLGEINFNIWRYSNTAKDVMILAYSYGPHPRCYIEGCEIVKQP